MVPKIIVWVSFGLCQCIGRCIFLGVRINSCVALFLEPTRRIEICGESLPRSGAMVCHFTSSYRALMAWEAALAAGAPSMLRCAAACAATSSRRDAIPNTLIRRRISTCIEIPFGPRKSKPVYTRLARRDALAACLTRCRRAEIPREVQRSDRRDYSGFRAEDITAERHLPKALVPCRFEFTFGPAAFGANSQGDGFASLAQQNASQGRCRPFSREQQLEPPPAARQAFIGLHR